MTEFLFLMQLFLLSIGIIDSAYSRIFMFLPYFENKLKQTWPCIDWLYNYPYVIFASKLNLLVLNISFIDNLFCDLRAT